MELEMLTSPAPPAASIQWRAFADRTRPKVPSSAIIDGRPICMSMA